MKNKISYLLFLFLCFHFSFSFSQAWNQLITTGNISPRSNASAIYIPLQNKMFVFGGTTSSGNVNELWCLDLNLNNWSLVPSNSAQLPAPRATHVCMYDSLLNRMLVWSGQGSALFNDVWAFNFNDSTWIELFPDGNITGAPLKRYGTATVYDPLNRNIINFAGFTTAGRFDDTWSFNVDSSNWTDKTNTYFPLLRCLTSQSFAADRREMIVFAGQSTGNLNDLWALNADTYIWTNLTPAQSPPSRHFPSNVYCGNGNIVVFGGNSLNQGNISGGLNDLWAFNLDNQLWNTLPQGALKPLSRYGHTAIYIPSQDKMIISGGQGTSTLYSETWEYSGISVVLSSVDESNLQRSSFTSYPNPSKGKTSFSFSVTHKTNAILTISDMSGKVVATPLNTQLLAGEHIIHFDTNFLAPGVYSCSLKTNAYAASILIILQ